MMSTCCLVEKMRTSDGAGGFVTEWRDGAQFMAAITMDTTLDAQVAERSGVTSVFTVTAYRSCELSYHDVIKRLSDGRIFRVTSDNGDSEAPKAGTLDIAQYRAEKWELTT